MNAARCPGPRALLAIPRVLPEQSLPGVRPNLSAIQLKSVLRVLAVTIAGTPWPE